jgi:hypothetical protein
MITRFFRAVRDLPGNPYGHRAALRASLLEALAAHKATAVNLFLANTTLQHHKAVIKGQELDAILLKDKLAEALIGKDAAEQACDHSMAEREELTQAIAAFMDEREELKATIAARDVLLGDLIGAYKEAEAEVTTLRDAVVQHEGVTIPLVQGVEAELKACGITIGQTEGDKPRPVVMVASGILATAIRGRRAQVVPVATTRTLNEADAATYLDVTATLSA